MSPVTVGVVVAMRVPSQRILTGTSRPKPDPVTVNVEPATPSSGESWMLGAATATRGKLTDRARSTVRAALRRQTLVPRRGRIGLPITPCFRTINLAAARQGRQGSTLALWQSRCRAKLAM